MKLRTHNQHNPPAKPFTETSGENSRQGSREYRNWPGSILHNMLIRHMAQNGQSAFARNRLAALCNKNPPGQPMRRPFLQHRAMDTCHTARGISPAPWELSFHHRQSSTSIPCTSSLQRAGLHRSNGAQAIVSSRSHPSCQHRRSSFLRLVTKQSIFYHSAIPVFITEQSRSR